MPVCLPVSPASQPPHLHRPRLWSTCPPNASPRSTCWALAAASMSTKASQPGEGQPPCCACPAVIRGTHQQSACRFRCGQLHAAPGHRWRQRVCVQHNGGERQRADAEVGGGASLLWPGPATRSVEPCRNAVTISPACCLALLPAGLQQRPGCAHRLLWQRRPHCLWHLNRVHRWCHGGMHACLLAACSMPACSLGCWAEDAPILCPAPTRGGQPSMHLTPQRG